MNPLRVVPYLMLSSATIAAIMKDPVVSQGKACDISTAQCQQTFDNEQCFNDYDAVNQVDVPRSCTSVCRKGDQYDENRCSFYCNGFQPQGVNCDASTTTTTTTTTTTAATTTATTTTGTVAVSTTNPPDSTSGLADVICRKSVVIGVAVVAVVVVTLFIVVIACLAWKLKKANAEVNKLRQQQGLELHSVPLIHTNSVLSA